MSEKSNQEEGIITTIKKIMRNKDFDVDIQPVGRKQPEIITGTSKEGTFKMEADPSRGIKVTTDGKEAFFNGQSDNYIAIFNLKHECYEFREHNYRWDGNKWVKKEQQPGIWARMSRVFGNGK